MPSKNQAPPNADAPPAGSAPTQEDLMKAAEAAKAAQAAQSAASAIRAKLKQYASPTERSKAMQEAYAKEVEAHGQSKLARRLQSGTWQGAGGGAGIGGVVGLGVGTVVGTLVGGITAIPTTAIGGLVGAGTGAIHGPFVKLGGDKQKDAEGQAKEMVKDGEAQGEMKDAMLKQAKEDGDLDEKGIQSAIAEAQAQAQASPEPEGRKDSAVGGDAAPKERKKPRKIEVRSGGNKRSA